MKEKFSYIVDQFADLQILRYQVPGFENLSLRQKQLLYHLSIFYSIRMAVIIW